MNINEIIEALGVKSLIFAGLTMTVSGVIGFWVKDVPKKMLNWIKRNFVTTIDIDSSKFDFTLISQYIGDNYKNKKFRSYKLDNNDSNYISWDNERVPSKLKLGYGYHFIWYKKQPLYISISKEENNHTNLEKDRMQISKFGRSKKIFEELLSDANNLYNQRLRSSDCIYVNMSSGDYGRNVCLPKRSMSSIFLPHDVKDKIDDAITDFINNKQWYVDHGIPYHLGIMLYGPPGTGKSSLIHAIASKFNKDIRYIPPSKLNLINNSDNASSEIVVVEDIDSSVLIQKRESVKKLSDDALADKKSDNDLLRNLMAQESGGISDILNAMDGLTSNPGMILICTTNHIENIDPAVIRPGRIDICQEISEMDRESVNEFMMAFFNKPLPEDVNIKPDLYCSKLQNMILMKNTYDEVLDFVKA